MVRACEIIAKCLRAVSSHKDRPGVANLIEIIKWRVNTKLKMLGSELVGNFNHDFKRVGNNDFSVSKGFRKK